MYICQCLLQISNLVITVSWSHYWRITYTLERACPNYSTKGRVAAAHSLTNQLSEDWDQLSKWVRFGVLLLGWKENLQPHDPLWNRLDMPALVCLQVYESTTTCKKKNNKLLEPFCGSRKLQWYDSVAKLGISPQNKIKKGAIYGFAGSILIICF